MPERAIIIQSIGLNEKNAAVGRAVKGGRKTVREADRQTLDGTTARRIISSCRWAECHKILYPRFSISRGTKTTQLGSDQNLKLVNFVRNRSCLFVEGNDFKYLKIIARKINENKFAKEDGFSVVPLEGFSNWRRLVGVDWIFTNVFGEKVNCFVILDRDYYSNDEIGEITEKMKSNGVDIHIWKKKEIENYLLIEDKLYELFKRNYFKRYEENPNISLEQFKRKIISICDEFKSDVFSQILSNRLRMMKSKKQNTIDDSTVYKKALDEFEKNWKENDYKTSAVSGKDFFKQMNEWLLREYKISISIGYIVNSLSKDDIDTEIQKVIKRFIKRIEN